MGMELIGALVVLILVGIGCFSLGTRRWLRTSGGHCEVDDFWWFGSWVTCKGGERCSSGKCKLQLRMKGTEEHWADAGVIPGGSVKWSDQMEYRCVCD